MRFSRWPALVVLVALVAAAWLVDRDHERDTSASTEATTPLEAQGYLPVAPPPDALSSTWYCAGGGVGDSGGDTTIIVANGTGGELTGTATIFPSIPPQIDPEEIQAETGTTTTVPSDEDDDATTTTTAPDTPTSTTELTHLPVTVDVDVDAYDRTEIRLGDTVSSPYAAALIEVPGGAVAVEQRVDGPNGADVSPCTSQAADSWYFAEGRTGADATMSLAFFNPFPDPAVLDVTFRTEDDLRTPTQFEAYAVPAQSLVVEDIGQLVTRRDHVSVSVEARSGRLVVNRLLDLDGSAGARGLELTAGAPVPAASWFFPDGIVAQGVRETFVVYNPGDTAAEVDLEIQPDDPARFGAIEPFGLTIPPQGFQEVAVQDEERIATALADVEGERVLRHSTRVVSVSNPTVPVVVERVLEGDSDGPRPGYDLMIGAPLLMEQAVMAASAADGSVIVSNPSGSTPARVTLRSVDGGSLGESASATDLEVPPAGSLVLQPEEIGLTGDAPLLIESDQPVAVERHLVIGDPQDGSAAIAVPLAGAVVEPPDRFD